MECEKTFLDEDFDDGGETLSANETENINSSCAVGGSPLSISVSLESQDSTSSSSTKVLGHNYNGTAVFTCSPKNQAELQLYRVMQRASLLSYYDTLLEMGGDDVQQLCDAGEEEFLEIMALVGMAAKPLHVRRFQKALREWLTNPLMFQTPLTSSASSGILPRPLSVHNVTSSPLSSSASATSITSVSSPHNVPLQHESEFSSCASSAVISSPAHCSASSTSPTSPVSVQGTRAILEENQIRKLGEAARKLVSKYAELEPKRLNAKKKVDKELQMVLNMSTDDPFRMQQIRKFSAIYGRFDCKRKAEKPLTLHEISVNEAAAQICKHIPALLTRRDKLFPLAREVVRNSGYHYSKGHSKSFAANDSTGTTSLMNTFKYHNHFRKTRTNQNTDIHASTKIEENSNSDDSQSCEDEDTQSSDTISIQYGTWYGEKENENSSLAKMSEDFELKKIRCKPEATIDRNTNSNTSSPTEDNFQVIACKGEDIIAVTNPALQLSSNITTIISASSTGTAAAAAAAAAAAIRSETETNFLDE